MATAIHADTRSSSVSLAMNQTPQEQTNGGKMTTNRKTLYQNDYRRRCFICFGFAVVLTATHERLEWPGR